MKKKELRDLLVEAVIEAKTSLARSSAS